MLNKIFLTIILSSFIYCQDFNLKNFINNEFSISAIGEIPIKKDKPLKFNSIIKYSGNMGIKEFFGKKYTITSLSDIKLFGYSNIEERYIFLLDRDNIISYISIINFVDNKKEKEIKCELSGELLGVPNVSNKDFKIGPIPYTCMSDTNISIQINFSIQKNNKAKLSFIIERYINHNKDVVFIKSDFLIDKEGKVLNFNKEVYSK